jgi:DNA helicase II / ATP-dependent DNA helicase pcrA
MNIPERATKEQIDTMTDTEGNIRVSSVPGSGKTFVLTYRIAYLITEMFVEPSSIVALTFTNKAAAQMKHRLRDIVGDNANCFTGTFHGYCNMFLKEEIHRMSFPKTFTILDKKAELDMIKNVAEDMGISLKDNTAKKIMSDIDINLLDCINNSRILIKGETEQMLPKLKFDVGDIVRHKVFGVGEIIKIDNITQTYEIQFRNIRGTRRIMFRAELEKVSQPD